MASQNTSTGSVPTATEKTRKGLRGRFFIGTLKDAEDWDRTVMGKIEKQLHGSVYALRLWHWTTRKPQDIRVLDLASPEAASFSFFNTLDGLNKRAKRLDRRARKGGNLLAEIAQKA